MAEQPCIETTTHEDAQAILALQEKHYNPFLVESPETFESILDHGISYKMIFMNEIVGYMLMHYLPDDQPPPLNTPCCKCSEQENIFIHDILVSNEFRGKGIAQTMIEQAFKDHSSAIFSLISLPDAIVFWEKVGFKLTYKYEDIVATYGPGSAHMTKCISW